MYVQHGMNLNEHVTIFVRTLSPVPAKCHPKLLYLQHNMDSEGVRGVPTQNFEQYPNYDYETNSDDDYLLNCWANEVPSDEFLDYWGTPKPPSFPGGLRPPTPCLNGTCMTNMIWLQ